VQGPRKSRSGKLRADDAPLFQSLAPKGPGRTAGKPRRVADKPFAKSLTKFADHSKPRDTCDPAAPCVLILRFNARCSLIRGNTHGDICSEGEVHRQAGNDVPVWDVSRVPIVPGIPG
jgi:hypothetical protein